LQRSLTHTEHKLDCGLSVKAH